MFSAFCHCVTCVYICLIAIACICFLQIKNSFIHSFIHSFIQYVDDVTIPTQVIKYNPNFLQADQPIRLQYSNQIKLFLFNKNQLIFHQHCNRTHQHLTRTHQHKIRTKKNERNTYISFKYQLFFHNRHSILKNKPNGFLEFF